MTTTQAQPTARKNKSNTNPLPELSRRRCAQGGGGRAVSESRRQAAMSLRAQPVGLRWPSQSPEPRRRCCAISPAEEAFGRTNAGQSGLERPGRKKLLTPRARHAAVQIAVERHGLSATRHGGLLGVDRSAVRYRKKRKDDAADRELLRALAAERRRLTCTLTLTCRQILVI